MNRRPFIHSSLSCAALTAPAITLTAAETGATKPRIPIAFLGATYSPPDKIKLAMTSPDWEFVGVCDESPAGRQTCAKLGARLVSQDELLQRAQVVGVESEVRDHSAHALLGLKADKHVHLERRYNPGFTAIFEAVRQGWLGDVFLVRGYIRNNLAPTLSIELTEAAGPYQKGSQSVPMPTYQRYEGDYVELAAAVRAEKPLSVFLDEELLVAETVLRISDML